MINKNIDEFAKHMTKEEFLSGIKVDEDEDIIGFHDDVQARCPAYFGLQEDCPSNCKECWKQAIANVKFKGDKVNFD